MSAKQLRVTVWNEFIHERQRDDVAAVYPHGIHTAIADGLSELLGKQVRVRTATLDSPQHGLDESTMAETDVLMWWGHMAHDQVDNAVVQRVHQRVLNGMGLVVLHSGHASKIFQGLMGTSCMLRWREAHEIERIWIVNPSHPIAAGLPVQAAADAEHFELPRTEMYGEFFDIPQPDELVFISWFEGGEVFRSGCTFERGAGRIFYFRPGHETYPIYYDPNVRRVLANSVLWVAHRDNPLPSAMCITDAREIKEPLSPVRGI